jgi:GNAT superfamily N-acetyltransferase
MASCRETLRGGLTLPDRSGSLIVYRYLLPIDSVEALTELLHESYAPLAAAGMRFMASHQDAELTRRRMDRGETIVAVEHGAVVGLITLATAAATSGSPFYDRADVASFGQFAVHPRKQRLGIGSTLLSLVEARAAELGVGSIALDTSERAAGLIAFYEARGYTFIEHCQWETTNYRSVVMARRISGAGTEASVR